MVASNSLAYGSELLVVRALDEDTAKNAGSQGTAILIKNEDTTSLYSSALDAVEPLGCTIPRHPW